MSRFDERRLRDGFGEFITGVTVITTLDADGIPTGLTANSFSSLSLEPPLLMFALGKESDTLGAFEAGNGFVVHVLTHEQLDLAERFAVKGVDRFEDLPWEPGLDGLPVLGDALAIFECRAGNVYDGGDHLILVGRVERLAVSDRTRPALGYFRSAYVSHPGPHV